MTKAQEFASRWEARDAAVQGLRDLMTSYIKGGGISLASFVKVEDLNRQHAETISFTDAVSLAGKVEVVQGQLQPRRCQTYLEACCSLRGMGSEITYDRRRPSHRERAEASQRARRFRRCGRSGMLLRGAF
jgi:hypothetical protein